MDNNISNIRKEGDIVPRKKFKGGPLSLGDFWGPATLAGDEDPKDPWLTSRDPWKSKRRKR